MLLRSLGLASLALFAGCLDQGDVQRPDDTVQTKSIIFEIPQVSPPPVDILLVVDNSPAMANVEDNVLANVPALATLLEQNRGWWDRHIGVVTADVGCTDGGTWRAAELTNDRFFIDWRHLDNTRTKNFDGTLEDHLPRAVSAGHEGCGANRPLDAIAAALDPSTHFRRADADLVIIVLAASDDQSALSVDDARTLVGLTDETETWRSPFVFAFAPEGAARLGSFARNDGVGGFTPITNADLFEGLRSAGHNDLWGGEQCFENDLDLDRSTDGLQASCAVSDIVRDRETNIVTYERVLPACTGSNRPCWRIEARPIVCSTGPVNYGIQIDRVDFPPRGTVVSGQCEVAEIP
jgi:hypothetical protein